MTIKSALRVCVFFCLPLLVTLARSKLTRMALLATPTTVFENLTESFNLTCVAGTNIQAKQTMRVVTLYAIVLKRVDKYVRNYGEINMYRSKVTRGRHLPPSASIRGFIDKKSPSGYLDVTLPSPKFDPSSAAFQCIVKGYIFPGWIIKRHMRVNVQYIVPSLSNLVPHVQNLLNEMEYINASIETALHRRAPRIPHVEGGTVVCKSRACGCKWVLFRRWYHSPPAVIYAPVRIDVGHSRNIRLSMYTRDLTRGSFRLCGYKWQDTKVYSLNMVWMTFGY